MLQSLSSETFSKIVFVGPVLPSRQWFSNLFVLLCVAVFVIHCSMKKVAVKGLPSSTVGVSVDVMSQPSSSLDVPSFAGAHGADPAVPDSSPVKGILSVGQYLHKNKALARHLLVSCRFGLSLYGFQKA